MKKTVIISVCVGLAAVFAALLFLVILPNSQYDKVRTMSITDVNLETLADGSYYGEYGYSQTDYAVNVQIKDHKIVSVDITGGGESEQAKAAEGVIDEIINEQRIDVDVVSGATTSSKAILKAVENALTGSAQ